MNLDSLMQHPVVGRVLMLLGAMSLLFLARSSELLWLFTTIAVVLAFMSEKATSRPVYGLYGIFLWALFAMELNQRYGSSGQLFGVFSLYLMTTLIVRWLTATDVFRSWVLAQAVGIVVAESYLVLLFWPVNFPSQALMITAVGFLGLEIIRLAHERNLSIRTLGMPVSAIALATTGIVLTATWTGY